MASILRWNLSRLKTKSRDLTGPLPDMYVREITQLCEQLQGVYISGIQVGDPRRFAIPNPRFKSFPVLYNPVITDQYDLIKSEKEGCLSFPGLWISIPRFKYVSITYRDANWKEITATFGSEDQETEEGLLSKAIQHEIFHMDGCVIHDRMKNIKSRLKVQANILQQSLAQNKTGRVPELKEGPKEIDPCILEMHTEGPNAGGTERKSGNTIPGGPTVIDA